MLKVDGKTDGSPVTEADLAADLVIAEGLAQVAPDIPSLSEERAERATLPYDLWVVAILAFVWLVPPDWLRDPTASGPGLWGWF